MAQALATDVDVTATNERGVKTSIVAPVFNEVENLPPLLRELFQAAKRFPDHHQPVEIIFVEDGSDDGSAEWIDDHARESGAVRAVHLGRNWGQSAALAAGFETARGETIVAIDADLQNDPADIPALLDKLDAGNDCVSGYRKDRNDPWHKTIPSAIQTRLAKLTGPDINDFGCTLTAYNAAALDDIDLYGEEHRYIPAQLHDRGYSVDELVVNHREREHGESRYGAGRLVRGFSDLVFHFLWNRYSSRPMHLFGGGGFAIAGAGAILGLWVTLGNFAGGEPLAANLAQLLLSVGMVLFGTVLVLFGILMQFLTRLYYRDGEEYRIESVVE